MAISDQLRAAILSGLFEHECGSRDNVAYRLSFAEIDASGPSFGKLQNDTHVNPLALHTLQHILEATGTLTDKLTAILQLASQHCPKNPFDPADYALINAAIGSDAGRALVDTLDEATLDGVIAQLNRCVSFANLNSHARIEDGALIACALWINASGAPTTLLKWLSGSKVYLAGGLVPEVLPGSAVSLDDVVKYLSMTGEFRTHPKLMVALEHAVSVGMKTLAT